jgi:hypothetical protein
MEPGTIHPLTMFLAALLVVFTLDEFFGFLIYLARKRHE